MTHYSLPIPEDARRHTAAGWLMLGVGSLLVSGLFAVLIVLSRTPVFQDLVPWNDFFHSALVVHVNLSVLVWFLAFAGVFWALHARHASLGWDRAALRLCVAGAGLMVLAPFAGEGHPLMSNYVPVLQTPAFLAALVVFAAGFAVLVARALLRSAPVGAWVSGEGALRFGLNTSVVAAAMALLGFAWSYLDIPHFIQGKAYYEILFWGGGHVLQFTHTQLMLVAWLWLASASGAAPRIGPRLVLLLFAWGLISVFLTPVIYLAHEVSSPQHRELFTWQMRFGGSLAALPIGLAVLQGVLGAGQAAPGQRVLRAALLWSVGLFGIGGLIGFLIEGSDVRIPAHYHGAIVAITLAFMGMSFHLLPKLGYRPIPARLGRLQPHLYGWGQLLHVSGLAVSGGYGVQRKTAGAAQGLDSLERTLGMGLMGLGGLIAIAGGVLFLLLVIRSLWPARARGRLARSPTPPPARAR